MKKSVLIADDTKNIRMLLTKCLEIEGYNVTTASDGREALALFLEKDFDLAFLDIKMPELSGTEVLKRIRGEGIDAPVVIITAYATVKNAVECTQMGAVAYLQKPFTADKVRSVLKELNDVECNKNTSSNISIDRIGSIINSGEYSKALDILKKVIASDVTSAELYLLLARAYEGLGNKEYAEKFYRTYELFK